MAKRFLSLLLVMAIMLTTLVPAFADTVSVGGTSVNAANEIGAVAVSDDYEAEVKLDSDGYYRFYIDGEVQTKWQVSPEGYKYYFSTSSSKYGAALTGANQKISSTYYNFTSDGKLIESYDSDGNPVLFCDPSQGVIYTIKYDAGEGTASKEQKRFRVSTQADLTVTAEKDGAYFAGWTDEQGSEQCLSSYEVTKNATLYAVYIDASDLKVELCDDGYYRYYIGGVAQTGWQVAANGYKYYFSASSSKYGAAMTGTNIKIGSSYYDFTSDGKLIESYDNSGNPVLFYDKAADFRPAVTYDYKTNGGTSATATTVRVNKGEKADLTVTAQKTNAVFVGWNTDKNANTALGSYTVTRDVVLYAIFADLENDKVVLCEDGYYRYYVGGIARTGWQVTPTGHKYYFSSSSSKYGAAMTGTGIKIGGNYYDFTADGKLIESYDSDGNPVLYYDPLYDTAVKKHTVVYDYQTNGGTSASKTEEAVFDGGKADLSVTAEKADCLFLGWNTDKNATDVLSELVVNSDVTLYAIFEKSGSDKVTLDSDGFYRYYIDGQVQVGFWILDGYKYYFSGSNATKGNAYVNQTSTIGGTEYTFNSNGVVVDKNNVPVKYKTNAEVVYLSAVYAPEGTTLTWTGAVENGIITGYRIYRAEGENYDNDDFVFIASVDNTLDGTAFKGTYNSTYSKYDFETPVNQVSYTDLTTNPNTVYIYKVEAIVNGDSASSTVAIRTKNGTERYVKYDEATDRWYYYIAGSVQTGWKITPDGHKCYFSTSTSATGAALEFDASIGSTVYNFTSYGALINSYDSNSAAVLYTEEIEIPGVTVMEIKLDSDGYYRFYIDGIIQTKWQIGPDGHKYFFSTSSSRYGAAMTGKNQKINSDYYDFTDDGKLIESYDEDGNPVLFYDEEYDVTPVVTYDANGGEVSLTSKRTKKGENADLTVTAKKDNLIFLGWNTEKNATEALSSYTVTGDVTLYAIYTDTIDSGSCGDNLSWAYKNDGTLFITGSGATNSWTSEEDVPWYEYRDEIENIVLDEEITDIGNNALAGLSKIKTLNIPEKTLYITTSLMGCSSLEEITVSSGNTRYNSIDGVLYGYEDSTLIFYPQAKQGTSYEIPATVEAVFSYAFAETRLEEITLPSALVKVAARAFYNCNNLKKVKYPLTADEWEGVYVANYNDDLLNALECASKMYTVTYDANGGTVSTSSVSVAEGEYADLTVTAEKTGYVFAGWNTDKNAATGFESYVVNGDITLYAIFVEAGDIVLCADGYYRYYKGGVAQTGFFIINGYKYYFSTSASKYGAAMTNTTVKIKGNSYTFDNLGKAVDSNGNAIYHDADIVLVSSEASATQSTATVKWNVGISNALVKGYNIYRDSELIYNSELPVDTRILQGEYKYNSAGLMDYVFDPVAQEITYKDETLFQNTTYTYTIEIIYDGGSESFECQAITEAYASRYVTYDAATNGWYYYKDSVAQTGWQVTPDGYKYYFSKSTGKAMVGRQIKIGSSYYDFADYGALIDSYDQHGDMVLYRQINGWYTSAEDGALRYYDNNVYRTGWQFIDGYKYYFSLSTGKLLTGYTQIGSVNYLLDESDGHWVGYYQTPYTIDESPKATDVVLTDDGYYKYYPNGEENAPLTGWKVLEGENEYYKYYFSSASSKLGGAITGYEVQVGGGFYNFYPTGALMSVDLQPDGSAYMHPYTLELTQGCKNGLLLEEDGKYRYFIDGEFQTGWLTIDGYDYLFKRSDGSAITDYNYKYGRFYYDFTEDGKLIRKKDSASSIYSITFAPGEGTGKEISLEIVEEDGLDYTLPENTYTKEGYTFVGWSDGVDIYEAGDKAQITADTAFTAVWKQNGNENNYVAEGTCGDNLTWTLDGAGTLTISGSGAMADYSTSGTNASPWYDHRVEINEVIIEEGVTSIGAYAFFCHEEMISIVIPEGVTSVGSYSFAMCHGLKKVTLPEGLTTIRNGAFSFCGTLNELDLPKSLTTVEAYAFEGVENLYKVNYGGSFTTWGRIEIGGGNDYLKGAGFHYGTKDYTVTFVDWDGTTIATLVVPDGEGATAPSDPVRDGYTFTGWDKEFSNVTEDITVTAQYEENEVKIYTVTFVAFDRVIDTQTVKEGESAIAPEAPKSDLSTFTGWDVDFSNVTSDLTVTAQYERHSFMVYFVGYEGIVEAQIIPNGGSATAPEVPAEIDGYVFVGWDGEFDNVTSDLNIYAIYTMVDPGPEPMPEDSGEFGDGLTWHYDGNMTLTISGNGGIPAFDPYSGDMVPWQSYDMYIKVIEVEEGITSIGNYAFGQLSAAISVSIPSTVTYISEQAFSELMAVEIVTISNDNDAYTTKDGLVFTKDETHLVYCPAHYSPMGPLVVELDEKVRTINPYAFAYNYFLEEVNVDSSNEYYYSVDGVLFETSASKLIYYPAGKQSDTGYYAIPDGTEEVGENAFSFIQMLHELYVPASVVEIGAYSFLNAMSLETITVSEDNENYASVEGNLTDKAGLNLYYCPTGTVPDGVQEIWEGAFDLNCVYEITIPKSITQIHSNVFYTFVSEINYLGSYEEWNAIYIAAEGNEYLEYANINYESTSEHSVTFVDWDGTVLKTEMVSTGAGASAPVSPTREGYIFAGWDVDFSNITSDVTVTAQYTASAGISGKCGDDLTWVLDGEGILTISGSGDMYDYIWELPEWDIYRDQIKKVEVCNGATSIGQVAFVDCQNLEKITVPDSVLIINKNSIVFCTSLSDITVSAGNENYTSVDGVLFDKNKTELIKCPEAKDGIYTIENGVEVIGEGAFSCCRNLTQVIIPDSVTAIEAYAFNGCDKLKKIDIPTGVTSIGKGAFYVCYSLTEITVADENEYYTSENGVLYNLDKTELICCPEGKDGELLIPASVTSLSEFAILGCYLLTGISVESGNLYFSSKEGVLFDVNGTELLFCPKNGFSGTYNIPETVTKIGKEAFFGCSEMTGVVIPASVTETGEVAFENCLSLTNITVSENNPNYSSADGVLFNKNKTEIKWFPGGKSGKYVVPDGVDKIGLCAFFDARNLSEIVIPVSVTSIQESAFAFCYGITDVYYCGTREQWEEITIDYDNDALLNAQIHFSGVDVEDETVVDEGVCGEGVNWKLNSDGVLKISGIGSTDNYTPNSLAPWAEYADSIKKVEVEEGITSLGNFAFYHFYELLSIDLPESLESIGDGAFVSCEGLKNIEIPENVISIGYNAFAVCVNLKSITIPDGVSVIENGTFMTCLSLESITLPDGITEIGQSALEMCEALNNIYFLGSAEQWAAIDIHKTNDTIIEAVNINFAE